MILPSEVNPHKRYIAMETADSIDKQSKLTHFIASNIDGFEPLYMTAQTIDAHCVQTYMTEVLKHLIVSWTELMEIPEEIPEECASSSAEITTAVLKISKALREEQPVDRIWVQSLSMLSKSFSKKLSGCMAKYLEEVSLVQSIVTLQLLKFTYDPNPPERIPF